jgi:uncharacterized protein (DUF2141 family)
LSRSYLFLLIPYLLLALSPARVANASDLEVMILGADAEGVVFVALFGEAEAYDEGRSMASEKVPATGEGVRAGFDGLAPGDYAIKVFQDRNLNDELDTNFIGLPKEPYGFSNDAMGRMGPPNFDQAKFPVTDEKTSIEINLQ